MSFSKESLKIIISSLFVAISLGPSSPAVAQKHEPRGEIRVVESWRPDINVLGHNVLQYLFEYALDKNELAPSLGVSRRWVDGTTLEVGLRRDVRFSNGEPFDAHAVKFNFDYQRRHNPGRGVQVYMKNVREIEVVDPHTVRIMLYQPDSLFLDKIILGPIAGWVIGAPKYIEGVGWEEFLRQPVGTGPYKVEGTVKDYRKIREGDVYARLVANPDYWNKSYPKIQKITFVHQTPKEALQALMEERVDLVTSLIPKDTLKVAECSDSKVCKCRMDVTYTVGFLNLMSPHTYPLRDIRVRKALNYAINKKELMRYAFKGNAVLMRGVLTEKSGVDLSETEPYEWNISLARKLLEEAGYDKGFKMTLFYHEKDYLIAQLLQRFFSLLKIETEITPMQWEWLVRHIAYPNTRSGYSWDDEDWWIVICSDASVVPELMGGHFEWSHHSGAAFQFFPERWMDPLDRMYQEVLQTRDRRKRFENYKKANEYIADQALWVFTMAPLCLYGVNRELDFVTQVSQYLYLEYSSVTDEHWSIRGKND